MSGKQCLLMYVFVLILFSCFPLFLGFFGFFLISILAMSGLTAIILGVASIRYFFKEEAKEHRVLISITAIILITVGVYLLSLFIGCLQ